MCYQPTSIYVQPRQPCVSPSDRVMDRCTWWWNNSISGVHLRNTYQSTIFVVTITVHHTYILYINAIKGGGWLSRERNNKIDCGCHVGGCHKIRSFATWFYLEIYWRCVRRRELQCRRPFIVILRLITHMQILMDRLLESPWLTAARRWFRV